MTISNAVVYAGTFDPITLGHQDLTSRAALIFPQVIVCVAENANKTPLFSLEERVSMAKEVLSPISNVRVVGHKGLLVEFLRRNQARVLVRGLRAVSDFEYEFQIAGMNRMLHADLETVFLTPGEEFMFVSATMVREIASLGGRVEKFVHPLVQEKLLVKFKKS